MEVVKGMEFLSKPSTFNFGAKAVLSGPKHGSRKHLRNVDN